MKYVVGFAFNESFPGWCLVVEKNRPDFMVGKLNGIGGKIEASDLSPQDAMVREFHEECGIETGYGDWNKFAVINGGDSEDHSNYEIHCFSAVLDNATWVSFRTMEDERIYGLPMERILKKDYMPNLNWLLPLARYHNNDFYVVDFERKYED